MLSHMTFVDVFNWSVLLVFSICYIYQFYYVFVVLTRKPPLQEAKANHKYAVMISARNESQVIGDLIHSIRVQNYPQELISIFVIADNCTDNTAEIARNAGATEVYERFNDEEVGKGYALNYGWHEIQKRDDAESFEAYFVFDADNVLDANYFREMNKVFDGGAEASTSYRNSKNYGSNWISAGYAIWFLREAKYLSQARLTLNTSCAISGTGFFIAAHVLKESGGWKWHLLTEDIEFSASSIIEGRRIAYCPTAMLYDEQPITFIDSWNQRFRWAKGFYQVFWHYAGKLFKGIFTNPKGKRFACYDMLMTIAPAMILTLVSAAVNGLYLLVGLLFPEIISNAEVRMCLGSFCMTFVSFYVTFFLLAVLTCATERKDIHATRAHVVMNLFTFPVFMLSYVPIALVAAVKKVDWIPTRHTISKSIDDLTSE